MKATIDLRALVLGAAARRVPTRALLATFAVSALIVWSSAWQMSSTIDLIPIVRVATVLLAAAAATCLEDPSELVGDTAPLGRWWRRSVAVVMTGSAAAILWWVVILGVAMIDRHSDGRLPVGGLHLEFVATCAAGWLLAAALAGATTSRGSGSRAALGVVIAALFSLSLPRLGGWLWAAPGPSWREAHERWAMIAIVALLGLSAVNRDPAIRIRPRWRSTR